MHSLSRTSRPEDFVGSYGKSYRTGILAEHADLFVAAGGTLRPTNGSMAWATVALYGTEAIPLVCGQIVRIDTEDGPIDGRCGALATDEGACPAHAEESRSWLAADESDRVAYERSQEVYV